MPVNGSWPKALRLGLLTLLVTAACSNEPPGSDADSAPSQSAAATSSEVMRAVSGKLETLETLLPGGVVVVRAGAKSQAVAFGKAETRPRRAMTSDDRFQIGSITKTMLATLVLQLVADGDLGLKDTVDELLPGLLPDGDQITVDHLLSNRSGLYNYTESLDLDFSRHWRPRDIVELATREPLLFQPGTQSSYSNTNYIVLGLIVEEATGRPVEQLLQTRIFDPAGMSATSLDPRRVAEPPIAHGYENGTDVTATDLSLGWTAGGVVSTAADLTHFMEALFQDRLGAHLLTEMSTWRGELDPGGVRYGLGLARIAISCGQAWGHSGEVPGFASQAWSVPDGTRSIVILLNETGYDDLATGAIDAALCT
jgi:D-alanyl-D-alanine carboxypeptidase